MKKLSLLLVLLLLVGGIATGCSSSNEPEAPANQGEPSEPNEEVAETGDSESVKDTLTVAMGAAPSTLDGNGKNDSASLQVRTQMYETLVKQDDDMSIIPSVAESWENVDDTTIVFKIREGIKFHDGTELKASDVEFSLKRADEFGFTSNYLKPIDFERSGATGDYEYTMYLQMPFAPILSNLTAGAAAIVPEAYVSENEEEFLARNPIGSGPYMYSDWVEGDRIELVKFDEYWDETDGVENIVFRFISEAANRAIEVEVGGVDIAYDMSPNDALRFEDNPEVTVQMGDNLSTTYIGFNYEKDLFKDVNVRKAVAHALNMPDIVEAVYFGLGTPGKNMVSPSVWGYSDNVPEVNYDVETAKQYLADAGYPDGFETKIWTSDNQQRIDVATIMQNQLAQVGIKAEVEIIEWGTFLVALQEKELDIFILGMTASTGDSGESLYNQFHSTSPFSGNTTYFKNNDVDRLLDLTREASTEDERLEVLEELQVLLMEEMPWVPVWHGVASMGLANDVQGFNSHPTGNHRLANVNFK